MQVVLRPLRSLIEEHVSSAERLHGDNTTVPILAKGKTDTGRTWVYVRDDRPFGGTSPPAALFYASRDRSGDHLERHLKQFTGILQADAYAGYRSAQCGDLVCGADAFEPGGDPEGHVARTDGGEVLVIGR